MEVIGHYAKIFEYPSAFFASLQQALLEGGMCSLIDKQVCWHVRRSYLSEGG
jgi:hypothetical protein